jgi:hypothetical protein
LCRPYSSPVFPSVKQFHILQFEKNNRFPNFSKGGKSSCPSLRSKGRQLCRSLRLGSDGYFPWPVVLCKTENKRKNRKINIKKMFHLIFQELFNDFFYNLNLCIRLDCIATVFPWVLFIIWMLEMLFYNVIWKEINMNKYNVDAENERRHQMIWTVTGYNWLVLQGWFCTLPGNVQNQPWSTNQFFLVHMYVLVD